MHREEMKSLLLRSFRTKSLDSVTPDTNLHRCLGIVDLTVVGIGGMIGSGIYVMAGITAKEQAGPGILVSFLLAAVVVLLVAACFTELAARLHKTGSTYLYLYLAVGELPAVVLGISILLSSLLSSAIDARAWSLYVNFLFNSTISNFTETYVGHWTVGPPLARYPDFVAVAVVIILTVVVALGAKCTTRFSAIFVVINIVMLCFVTICGIVFGHISNWTYDEGNGVGGGFMPFGWAGVLSGAASCFWAFSGFDMISCAVEESHSPQRHIPIATLLTMLIVTALYIGTAAGMTLLIPCQLLDIGAPLPSAFAYAGLTWARYIIVLGPLCGFTTASITSIYCFVRISLAMAEDGLLWSWFASVSKCTSVPVVSVIVCGLLQSVIACVGEIGDLISFNVSILLLSYSSACVAVIVLRYSRVMPQEAAGDISAANEDLSLSQSMHHSSESGEELSAVASEAINLSNGVSENSTDASKSMPEGNKGPSLSIAALENGKDTNKIDRLSCVSDHLLPDETHSSAAGALHPRCGCLESFMICKSYVCVKTALALMLMSMCGLAVILVYGIVPLESGLWWSIVLVTAASCGVAFFMCIICIHRQTLQTAVLMLPCVPLMPSVATFACLTLLVINSTKAGWIGCLLLLILAVVVYFTYGIHNSKLNDNVFHQQRVKYKQFDESTTALLHDDDDDDDEDDVSSL